MRSAYPVYSGCGMGVDVWGIHRCVGRTGVILLGPSEEMSRVPIQLRGDTLYMSSTLIKVMLCLFRDILLVCVSEGGIESHGFPISLHL